jgi:hypothetical protein
MKCKKCNIDTKYFKLNDVLCFTCNPQNTFLDNVNRIYKNMPFLFWSTSIILILSGFATIFMEPVPAYLYGSKLNGDIKWNFMVSFLFLIPLTMIYIIRFVIVRRHIHFVLAFIIGVFITGMFVNIVSIVFSVINSTLLKINPTISSQISLIGLFFIIASVKILNLKNYKKSSKLKEIE